MVHPIGREAYGLGSEDLITAPFLGTFRAASNPDSLPFVRIGDSVTVGQIIAIIEALSICIEIHVPHSGVVEEILVSDGEPVAFKQPLMRLS